MTPASNPEELLELKTAIESFVRSHENTVLAEDGADLMVIDSGGWRVSAEYGKLLIEAWNGAGSLVRRVEEVAYRDERRLGLRVRKSAGRETAILELRERGAAAQRERNEARAALRRELTAYIRQHFPEWRLERVSNRSDREHSFSAWYTRGVARLGNRAWAFLGLDPTEAPVAADAALAYGLNWLDSLRVNSERTVLLGLKLFLPVNAIPLNALRATEVDPRTAEIEIYEWPRTIPPAPIFSGDFANAETRLAPRRDAGSFIDRHRDLLRSVFGPLLDRIDAMPEAGATAISLRVFGLEIARLDGQGAPRLLWGVEGNRRIYREDEREGFREFVKLVLAVRHPASRDAAHEFYRLQPERWLESLLIRDLSKLDSALRCDPVYPQVPAFSGVDRGVVDILGVTKDGRLAVIELKLHEDITLPFQGLDYWLRVKWLNDRGQFREFGYFPGVELSPLPPLLYLASPAFRFHPSNERLIRYFRPSVEVIQIGLNQQWREGVKVLFRRAFRTQAI